MNFHLPKIPRRTQIILGTGLILVALLAFYGLYYVPVREQRIINQKSRALAQSAQNFIAKKLALEKSTVIAVEGASKQLESDFPKFFSGIANADDSARVLRELNQNTGRYFKGLLDEVKITLSPDPLAVLYLQDSSRHYYFNFYSEEFIQDVLISGDDLEADFQEFILYRKGPKEYYKVFSSINSGNFYVMGDSVYSHFKPIQYQGTVQRALVNNHAYQLFAVNFETRQLAELGHLPGAEREEWLLVGLVDEAHFTYHKQSVPTVLVIFYILLLTLLFISLPQLQILVISPLEQLSISNFIFFCLSVVLSFYLLTTIVLFTYDYFGRVRETTDTNLKFIGDAIGQSFDQNLKDYLRQVRELDTLITPAPNRTSNVFPLSSLEQPGTLAEKLPLDIVFWLDTTGQIIAGYNKRVVEAQSTQLSLANRAYYREHMRGRAWHNPIEPAFPFYIESIQSWSEDRKSAVLSIPSQSKQLSSSVVALEKQFPSLYHTQLPQGYRFMVVDPEGEVLFHYKPALNLQENLLAEAANQPELLTALLSPEPLTFSLNYKHARHRALAQPFSSEFTAIPWVIIVTYQDRLNTLPILLTTLYSLVCSFVVALVIVILFLLTTYLNKRPNKVAQPRLNIDWIRPKQAQEGVYRQVFLLNLLVIGLLILYNLTAVSSPFSCLLSFLYTISVLFLTVYLSSESRSMYRRRLFVGLVVVILGGIVFAWLQLEVNRLIAIGFLLIVLLLATANCYFFRKRSHKELWLSGGPLPNYRKSYVAMLFTYVIMSSVLPAFFLYYNFLNHELSLWTKYGRWATYHEMEEKEDALELQEQAYLYPDKAYFQSSKSELTRQVASEKNQSLYRSIRPPFNPLIAHTQAFIATLGQAKTATNSFAGLTNYKLAPGVPVPLSDSFNLRAVFNQVPTPYFLAHFFYLPYLPLLVMILAGLLVVVAILVQRAAAFYFFWDLLSYNKVVAQSDDNYLAKLKGKANPKLLLIDAGRHSAWLPEQFSNTHLIDLFGIDNQLTLYQLKMQLGDADNFEQVRILNFSYNPLSLKCWDLKLEILEELLPRCRGVRLFSLHRPIHIFSTYEEELKGPVKPPEADARRMKENLCRWRSLLHDFTKLFIGPGRELPTDCRRPDCLLYILEYERLAWPQYFSWLPDYAHALAQEYPSLFQGITLPKNERAILADEIILKVQSMAQPFYFSLWNDCSLSEKFILYDLAKDGFVNPGARQTLYLLLEKGLIYSDPDDRLLVRNNSFRNFILTNIRKGEATELRKRLRAGGAYSITKSVIILVFAVSLAFLAFTNQEHFNSLLGILTGLAALLPLLFKLSGLTTNSIKS